MGRSRGRHKRYRRRDTLYSRNDFTPFLDFSDSNPSPLRAKDATHRDFDIRTIREVNQLSPWRSSVLRGFGTVRYNLPSRVKRVPAVRGQPKGPHRTFLQLKSPEELHVETLGDRGRDLEFSADRGLGLMVRRARKLRNPLKSMRLLRKSGPSSATSRMQAGSRPSPRPKAPATTSRRAARAMTARNGR